MYKKSNKGRFHFENSFNLGNKYIIPILCLLILLSFGCKTLSHNKGARNHKEIVLKLEPGSNNPRNSEGDFVTLRNGRIIFIYSHFIGNSGRDEGNAYLASRYSDDGGKNWSSKDKLVVEQEGSMNVMSVSLLRLQNGDIALFYVKKNSLSDCIPMLRVSKDEAKSWSKPIKCITDRKGYFVLNNSRVIQLKDGRILMPVALHNTPGGKWSSRAKIYCYVSDDQGKTWNSSTEVPNPGEVVTQEPGLIELKDGNVLMFIRTNVGVQYFSHSKDKGETWSAVEPSNITSPLSPASMARIPGKEDLLMVWNNNSVNQNRTPLNIAISKDEGKTWRHIKTLEGNPDKGYCYTAIHFTDKNVLLSYCAGSQSKGILNETDIVKLSLDWIYQ